MKALFTFTHETFICIVMEYIMGGDFARLLNEYVRFDDSVAKFYTAEIVLALESLHQKGIVHRDLKPDNLLLDNNGHIKLTDFGLSEMGLENYRNNSFKRSETSCELASVHRSKLIREVSKRLLSSGDLNSSPELKKEVSISKKRNGARIIGTPDYIAPEVISGEDLLMGTLDFWALGVILFEFLTGMPPFNASSYEEIFDNITKRKIPWDLIEIGRR